MHNVNHSVLRALGDAGFSLTEARALVRASRTLHRWHERECGNGFGCIERDEATGIPYWRSADGRIVVRIRDYESAARKRIERILLERNVRRPYDQLRAYIQTDPRGAALYLMRPTDEHYTRGICVY